MLVNKGPQQCGYVNTTRLHLQDANIIHLKKMQGRQQLHFLFLMMPLSLHLVGFSTQVFLFHLLLQPDHLSLLLDLRELCSVCYLLQGIADSIVYINSIF